MKATALIVAVLAFVYCLFPESGELRNEPNKGGKDIFEARLGLLHLAAHELFEVGYFAGVVARLIEYWSDDPLDVSRATVAVIMSDHIGILETYELRELIFVECAHRIQCVQGVAVRSF